MKDWKKIEPVAENSSFIARENSILHIHEPYYPIADFGKDAVEIKLADGVRKYISKDGTREGVVTTYKNGILLVENKTNLTKQREEAHYSFTNEEGKAVSWGTQIGELGKKVCPFDITVCEEGIIVQTTTPEGDIKTQECPIKGWQQKDPPTE